MKISNASGVLSIRKEGRLILKQPPLIYKTWGFAIQITKKFLQKIESIKIKTHDVETLLPFARATSFTLVL